MGALKNCVLSAGENRHAHKIPRFRRGDVGFFGGAGEVPILFFLVARIFLIKVAQK